VGEPTNEEELEAEKGKLSMEEQSPGDRAKQLAKESRRIAKRSERLAKESLRLARQLHQEGLESDQQLEKAENLAARVEEASETVQLLGEGKNTQSQEDNVEP
jgi:hypothetical protein